MSFNTPQTGLCGLCDDDRTVYCSFSEANSGKTGKCGNCAAFIESLNDFVFAQTQKGLQVLKHCSRL